MSKYSWTPPEEKTGFIKNPLSFMKRVSTETKIIGGIGLVTILILFGGVFFLTKQGEAEQKKINKPLMGEEIKIQSSTHVQPGASHEPYNSDPPAGGPMYDEVAGTGIHEIQVPDEKLMHSLEHGAVVVHYKDDLPEDQKKQVIDAYNSVSGKKILVPRDNMDVPVALTSWGRLLKLQTIDEYKIKEFIEANSDRGPEKGSI